MIIDVAVMDADWRQEVRPQVIERILAAMANACGLDKPSPAWWVNFRTIDEGSWGSSGGVLSILSLLDTGVFTDEKEQGDPRRDPRVSPGRTPRSRRSG
jgi:hypothetical protein